MPEATASVSDRGCDRSKWSSGSWCWRILESAPRVERAAGSNVDAEVVTLSTLIPAALDRHISQVAEPQRADATMSNDANVAGLLIDEQVGEGGNNTGLRVDCSLPTPRARLGLGETGIGDHLVLSRRQETSRGAVDFAGAWSDLGRQPPMGGDHVSGLSCLRLLAADDPIDLDHPRQLEQSEEPLVSSFAEHPTIDGYFRVDHDIGVRDRSDERHDRASRETDRATAWGTPCREGRTSLWARYATHAIMPICAQAGWHGADVRYCGSESIDRLGRPVLCEHGVSEMPPRHGAI